MQENLKMKVLQEISDLIMKSPEITKPGLWDGNMGICIYLYHMARLMNDSNYEKTADQLLESVYQNIDSNSISFYSGISGIGWGIDYLIQKGFCRGNVDEILRDIDSLVFRYFHENRMLGISSSKGLTGLLFYVTTRLKHTKYQTDSEDYVILSSLLRSIIDRIYTVCPNSYEQVCTDADIDFVEYPYPLLILSLCEASYLNCYSLKIEYIIKQWIFVLKNRLPINHFHRLFLYAILYSYSKNKKNSELNNDVLFLLNSIDYSRMSQECNPYSYSLKRGFCGAIILLRYAISVFSDQTYHKEACRKVLQEIVSRDIPLFLTYLQKTDKAIPPTIDEGLAGIGFAIFKGLDIQK